MDGHFLFSQSANLCNLAYIKVLLCFYPCPRVCVCWTSHCTHHRADIGGLSDVSDGSNALC